MYLYFPGELAQCSWHHLVHDVARKWVSCFVAAAYWASSSLRGVARLYFLRSVCNSRRCSEFLQPLFWYMLILSRAEGWTRSRRWALVMAQPEADRRAWITERIEAFFPNLSAQTVLYDQKCWGEDPWVYGAWCDILPGQWWLFKAAGLAEGRVHFCGEHTSIWSGWMQGAIESGKRAAFEAHSAG